VQATERRAYARAHRYAPAPLALLLLLLPLPLAVVTTGCGDDDPSKQQLDGALAVPPGWSGEWSLTITFRDPDTGSPVEVEVIEDCLADGQSLVQPLVPMFGDCTGTVDGNHLTVSCASTEEGGPCRVDATFDLDVTLDGDTMQGLGAWSATITGDCGDFVSGGEEIEVTGLRTGPAPADCAGGAAFSPSWFPVARGLLR
jgi:hypothetical protein